MLSLFYLTGATEALCMLVMGYILYIGFIKHFSTSHKILLTLWVTPKCTVRRSEFISCFYNIVYNVSWILSKNCKCKTGVSRVCSVLNVLCPLVQ